MASISAIPNSPISLTSLLLSRVRIWSDFTFEFLGRFPIPLPKYTSKGYIFRRFLEVKGRTVTVPENLLFISLEIYCFCQTYQNDLLSGSQMTDHVLKPRLMIGISCTQMRGQEPD